MNFGQPGNYVIQPCACGQTKPGHYAPPLELYDIPHATQSFSYCAVKVTLVTKKTPEPFEPGRFEIDDELREPMDERGCFRRSKAETD